MSNYEKSYGLTSPLQDSFPPPILALRAPAATDINYRIGQNWIRTSTNQAWILTSFAGGTATWALSSPGASDVDTLTGDAGGAISPVLGTIILAGGTNIGTTGAGNTITFNLDPAVVLATSISSPLYTSAAADVLLVPGGVNDIVCRLGDAAGATFFRIQDSGTADVFTIDSNGVTSALLGLVVTGAFTQTAGIVNIGADAAANAINIGTGAAAKPITIGNVTGATAVNINSGTGACAWTTTNGSLGLVTGTGAINIGADAFAKTLTIGNITGATAVNVNTGTGGTTYTTTNGNFALNTGTGTIWIGTDAFAKILSIGNVTGGTSVAINSGTGGIALASTGAGDITLNSSDTVLIDGAGVVEINSSAGIISIGNDAIAQNINLGMGAAARVITLGNATGVTSVVVNGGTGAMQFGANAIAHATTIGSLTGAASTTVQAGTGDLILTSTDAATIDTVGVLELNSSGAAIGIGTDADAFAINLGTGAAARVITIGNATGATSVVIDCGTGPLNIGTTATAHITTIGSTTGASGVIIQSGTGRIDFAGIVEELEANFAAVSGDMPTFTSSPIVQSNANTGAAPTGATGDVNLLSFQDGMIMEEFVLGAGQTIIAPRMAAAGLVVSGDLTATEGYEYNFGAARANSRHSFTIGTSGAFYLQWRFTIADISGCEPCYIGFRRTQANDATLLNYTDFVAYGPNDAISPGDCAIQTQLNTGGSVNTDTNDAWADAATHTLRILVSAAGVVTFQFDGAPPTVTQAFTFDNGDVVHPFFRILHNAVVPGVINWVSMECGLQ